jgi:uncharacterized membrane protein YphA (DoxX/SURF4 family)
MKAALAVVQVIIAAGIYNVWILRFGKPTHWRGGAARNMKEEFAVYGLPAWLVSVVGLMKLLCATLLIVGVFVPALSRPAAVGLAVLMLGAVTMHLKVGDPPRKSLPALAMLALCLVVTLA